jgi:hypothetical protein
MNTPAPKKQILQMIGNSDLITIGAKNKFENATFFTDAPENQQSAVVATESLGDIRAGDLKGARMTGENAVTLKDGRVLICQCIRLKPTPIAKNPDKNWENNAIQFPRLIEEAQAAGAFSPEVIATMAASMDLSTQEVESLLERARTQWEAIKEKTARA